MCLVTSYFLQTSWINFSWYRGLSLTDLFRSPYFCRSMFSTVCDLFSRDTVGMGLYVNKRRSWKIFFPSNQPEYCVVPPHFLTSLLDRKGGRMSFGYGCPLHSQSSVYARWWSYTSPSLASVLPRPPALPLSPLYLVHLLVGELNLSTSACSLACFAGDKDVISQTPCWLYFPYCTYDWFLQIGV